MNLRAQHLEDAWAADPRFQLYPMLAPRIPTQPALLFVVVPPERP